MGEFLYGSCTLHQDKSFLAVQIGLILRSNFSYKFSSDIFKFSSNSFGPFRFVVCKPNKPVHSFVFGAPARDFPNWNFSSCRLPNLYKLPMQYKGRIWHRHHNGCRLLCQVYKIQFYPS